MLKCVSARISVVIDLSWLYSKLRSCACALAWQPERQMSRGVLIHSAFQHSAPGTALDQANSHLGNLGRKMGE